MDDDDSPLRARPLRAPLTDTAAPRDGEPVNSDLEKLKKWYEERTTRRLRGEYESAVRHVGELVRAFILLIAVLDTVAL